MAYTAIHIKNKNKHSHVTLGDISLVVLADNNFLQFVFTSKIQIYNKIHQREGCKTPVVVIKVSLVQIIWYPSRAMPYPGHPCNEGDDS